VPAALGSLPGPRGLSPTEKALAEHWLVDTKDRPVIRVHYDVADILSLVGLGRGLIVARPGSSSSERELYLLSKPDAPPLYAPYTPHVADRFSSYSWTIGTDQALGPLAAPFPVYFPNASSVALAFVPDRALAMSIFAEVAKHSPAIPGQGRAGSGFVFEGELTLRGAEPIFSLLAAGDQRKE
jgi:hypothetical protein